LQVASRWRRERLARCPLKVFSPNDRGSRRKDSISAEPGPPPRLTLVRLMDAIMPVRTSIDR
jgi:hypothetical protein